MTADDLEAMRAALTRYLAAHCSPDDAEALAQEVIVKCGRALDRGQVIHAGYVWRAALNMRRSWLRGLYRERARRERLEARALARAAEPLMPPVPDFVSSELLDLATPRQRKALVLRGAGRTYRQIGAAMRIDRHTAWELAQRGRLRIQAALTDRPGLSADPLGAWRHWERWLADERAWLGEVLEQGRRVLGRPA